jgi:hypothetical protein
MRAILRALTPGGVDVAVKDTSVMPTSKGLAITTSIIMRQKLRPPNERNGGTVLPSYRPVKKDDTPQLGIA